MSRSSLSSPRHLGSPAAWVAAIAVALVVTAGLWTLPSFAAAQERPAPRAHPAELALQHAEFLELTDGQRARLSEIVSERETAIAAARTALAAERAALVDDRLEARSAELEERQAQLEERRAGLEARRESMDARREAMQARRAQMADEPDSVRSAMRERMQERMQAADRERLREMRPDTQRPRARFEARGGMTRGGMVRGGARADAPMRSGLAAEISPELREARATLVRIERESRDALREILSEDQLRNLQALVRADRTGIRRGGGR